MTALRLVLDVLIALAGGVAAFGLTLDLIARAGMFGAPRGARPHDLLRDAPPPPARPPAPVDGGTRNAPRRHERRRGANPSNRHRHSSPLTKGTR